MFYNKGFHTNIQNYSKNVYLHNIIFEEAIIMPLTTKQIVIIAYASWLVLLSIITFIAYGVDKSKAKKGQYRTKEKTLLSLSFFGGAFGGYPAMLIFRHKTKGEHWYFTFVNWLGIIIHTTLMILLIFVFKF